MPVLSEVLFNCSPLGLMQGERSWFDCADLCLAKWPTVHPIVHNLDNLLGCAQCRSIIVRRSTCDEAKGKAFVKTVEDRLSHQACVLGLGEDLMHGCVRSLTTAQVDRACPCDRIDWLTLC